MKLRIYPVLLVPLLGIILVTLLLRLYTFPQTHAAPVGVGARLPLAGQISPAVSTSRVLKRLQADQPVHLAIGLSLRNQADLNAYLQQVTSPQSALYHHYLSSATFAALYAPLPASEAAVSKFLHSQGFTVTATYSHHLVIDVSGTVGQAEQAFQVHLNTYQALNGLRFHANDSVPSLPGEIAVLVSSVSGLDTSVQYRRDPLTPSTLQPTLAPASSGGTPIVCPQPGAATVPTAYTPQQVATAYNFSQLYAGNSGASNLGEGQTVGLLELDGFSPNDIALYASCFGGKYTAIKSIPIDGYNGAAGPNALEVELDMEMVLGLAPRLASLRVYEASITSLAAYNDAWARIIADNTPVVSTSWVFCEQGPGMTSEIQQENIFFQAAAAQGQTILAASGDLGANGCYKPQTNANASPAVDDPASQPYVTGVGGTTLHINTDNTYASERVWNERATKNGAGGGGLSRFWYSPRWQQGPGVANAYSTGYREVPDVAANADPLTGYDVYCNIGGCAGGGNKGWYVVGGTSAAAPIWAAMVALANEAIVKANGYLLGFLNPSLYAMSYGAVNTSYASAFHDIVPVPGAVNNNDYVGNSGTYPAADMYDMATGLGSFDAYNLTQSLLQLGQDTLPRTTPTSTIWYFAEGRVGSDFQEFLTLENPDPTQAAQVQVQYLLEGGTGPTVIHTVAAQSRSTVNVNGDVATPSDGATTHSLSMIVTSQNGVGIVAERPMYFSWHAINSGTDALGATKLGKDFYFADVESEHNYSSFITILNPPGGQSANITVSYFAGGLTFGTATLIVPPGQRGTTSPMAIRLIRNAAVHVSSDQPVVVERPTYFSTARSNISGPITGAATVVGTPSPLKDWLFAEGYTGANFHEYMVLANFETSVSHATVSLEYSNGQVNPVTVIIPARSQVVFDVNTASSAFALSTSESSAEVASDVPIVVQRIEYFRFAGSIPGGTDVIGQPGPAKTAYSFAEGYTATGFSEFLTLQNPNTIAEDVAVTFYLANGITTQQIVRVGPQMRVTLSINTIVELLAQGNPTAGHAVALTVQAINGTIVAERPMYFNFHTTSQGGSDVVGYTG